MKTPKLDKLYIEDRVKIINYGQLIWKSDGKEIQYYDLRSDLVGEIGTIHHTNEDGQKYSVDLDNYGNISWFIKEQLEKI